MIEHLAPFFADWSSTVTRSTGCSFTGIIEAPFVGVGEVAAVESAAVSLLCKTSDVSDLASGTVLAIEGVEYTIRGVEPDGTGVTVLRLEKV